MLFLDLSSGSGSYRPSPLCLSSSPTSHYPMMMLPSGQAVPVLPGPGQMPSVINVRPRLPSPHRTTFQIHPKNGCILVLVVYPCVCVCLLVVRFLQLARQMCMVPNIPGIPGPPLGGSSSGSNSPSGYSISSEAKMVGISSSLYF